MLSVQAAEATIFQMTVLKRHPSNSNLNSLTSSRGRKKERKPDAEDTSKQKADNDNNGESGNTDAHVNTITAEVSYDGHDE